MPRSRSAMMRKAHRRACVRKIPHDTIAAALRAIAEVRAAGRLKDDKPQVYLCTHCGRFHWGHLGNHLGTKQLRQDWRDHMQRNDNEDQPQATAAAAKADAVNG